MNFGWELLLPKQMRYQTALRPDPEKAGFSAGFEASGIQAGFLQAHGRGRNAVLRDAKSHKSPRFCSLAVLATLGALFGAHTAAAQDQRPNFLLILMDDADPEAMNVGLAEIKTRLNGAVLENFFSPTPECGPARASLLRGQYAHNTRVLVNADSAGFYSAARDPVTGLTVFRDTIENDTVAVRLKDAGYRTGHFGKYLNGFGSCNVTGCTPPAPAGWDVHYNTVVHGDGPQAWTNFRSLRNGVLTIYGTEFNGNQGNELPSYEPYEVARNAVSFIRTTPQDQPFMAMVHFRPPHLPSTPHPSYADAPVPPEIAMDPASFGLDAQGQPQNAPASPQMTEVLINLGHYPWTQEIVDGVDQRRIERYRSMLFVRDMIGKLLDEIEARGQTGTTIVFIGSDNGWHNGQHSIPRDKGTFYKEASNPPLWIAGPGTWPHTETRLAGIQDIAPTMLNFAGLPIPAYMDGRSLRPLMNGNLAAPWRTAILGQSWSRYDYDAVFTLDWKLALWRATPSLPAFAELYARDGSDENELANLALVPGYGTAKATMHARLVGTTGLKYCGRPGYVTCKVAEDQ